MNITEDEAALYDRQIRLWGLDAQKRLRSSTILLAGLGGLGAEITKNLVLGGVKSITLLDDRKVTDIDTAQFLFQKSDGGQNRAEASKAAAQALNPMVTVLIDTDSLETKSEDYFASFSVVCIAGCYPPKVLIDVDKACRKHNVKFYCGDAWGLYGYGFVDLGQHTFLEERNLTSSKEIDTDSKNITMKLNVQQKVFEYPSLEKSLAVKSGKSGTGLDKRTSQIFFLLRVLLKFAERHKRNPENGHRQKDSEELLILKKETFDELGVDESRLSDQILGDVFGELSPVCAIVGGILAQDIIKAVSGKDTPLRNYFLFDGNSCCGTVEYVGK